MAFVFFTAKNHDGNGDIVQTVKITEFVDNLMKSKDYQEKIIIVVPNTTPYINHLAAMHSFLENPSIEVLTVSEFKENMPQVDCFIEVSTGACHFQPNELNTDIPYIYMPEYDNDTSPSFSSSYFRKDKPQLKICGGFKEGNAGVIPSIKLLSATNDETSLSKEIENSFDKLDPQIKKYLGKDLESCLKHRESCDFSFQYCNDKQRMRLDTTINDKPIINDTVLEGTNLGELFLLGYTPTHFFLLEHACLTSQSTRSQDVLCLGVSKENKQKSLVAIKETLIQNGYTKIVFTDIDEDSEEILYHDENNSSAKQYRLLYSKKVSYATMQTLPLLATEFIGATGDQSFVEAMSAGKLVTYECVNHKKPFAQGYLEAVRKKTTNEKVILLAKYLMKIPEPNCTLQYSESSIRDLLMDKMVVDELKKINKALIAESQYFEMLETMLLAQLDKARFGKKEDDQLEFTEKLIPVVETTLEQLKQNQEAPPTEISQSKTELQLVVAKETFNAIVTEINNYIKSREGSFLNYFRNTLLTKKKIDNARSFLEKLNKSDRNLETIKDFVSIYKSTNKHIEERANKKYYFTKSHFEKSLNSISTLLENENEEHSNLTQISKENT